jgi:hypothetical protein
MGFLGMAFSSRVSNCTGSPPLHRYLAIVIPPLLMFLASGIGAAVGGATMDIPILYIALVAFGVVALLFLVCNELLIEAKEAQGNIVISVLQHVLTICEFLGEDERMWVSALVFAGILVVLMLDHILPK